MFTRWQKFKGVLAWLLIEDLRIISARDGSTRWIEINGVGAGPEMFEDA